MDVINNNQNKLSPIILCARYASTENISLTTCTSGRPFYLEFKHREIGMELTLDGEILVLNDVILLKDQDDKRLNGIWQVIDKEQINADFEYCLKRPDESLFMRPGTFVLVKEGETLCESLWVFTADDDVYTLGVSLICFVATVNGEKILPNVDVCECKTFYGIENPSSSHKAYKNNGVSISASPTTIISAEATEEVSTAQYGQLALKDDDPAVILADDPRFMLCFLCEKVNKECIRQIDICACVSHTVTCNAIIQIWNYTTAQWEIIVNQEITAGPTFTQLVGTVCITKPLEPKDYINNVNKVFFLVYPNTNNSDISIDFAEVCLKIAKDGDTGPKGEQGECCKCIDFVGITPSSGPHVIWTNKGISTSSSPVTFIADEDTLEVGPDNTHGGAGTTLDYTKIDVFDGQFMGVQPNDGRFLFKLVCTEIPQKCIEQIAVCFWTAVSSPTNVIIKIWNHNTTTWLPIINKNVTAAAPTFEKLTHNLMVNDASDFIDGSGEIFLMVNPVSSSVELDIDYMKICVKCGCETLRKTCVDFEDLLPGSKSGASEPVTLGMSLLGITPSFTANSDIGPLMIFDSENPGAGDLDLGTPNQDYGGPGIGTGGAKAGAGPNFLHQKHILIISKDGDSEAPCDAPGGGTMTFEWNDPVRICFVDILDIEENGAKIQIFDALGTQIGTDIPIANLGDNSWQRITINTNYVAKMTVTFPGSGALSQFCYEKLISCTVGITTKTWS